MLCSMRDMGSSAKANTAKNSKSTGTERRGTGLLVVFFPEDNNNDTDKTKLCSTSSRSSAISAIASSFRRRNSNPLLSKAQSTISICALLVFVTLLLFTLSTFEPTIPSTASTISRATPRRFLSQKTHAVEIRKNPVSETRIHYWFARLWRKKSYHTTKSAAFPSVALQGMGTLFRRGTRAMNDLVVGHVGEDVTEDELRLFLRLMHRSGLTARADISLIFGSPSISARFGSVIQEENNSFLTLIHRYREWNFNTAGQKQRFTFDVEPFFKAEKKVKEVKEPLWGKKTRSNTSDPNAEQTESSESTRPRYGSVLSFEVTELDPENTLSGFIDHVPLSLRRWACYPMLLGRVRHNFKHVMLVDVKNLLVLSDPLSGVKNWTPETVYLHGKPESTPRKHSKKSSDKTLSQFSANSAIVIGGARGIRRLSNTMLTEIVRATTQTKKKGSVTESGILSQLVGNHHLLKNVNLMISTESIPDTISLSDFNSPPNSTSLSDYIMIQRGNANHDLHSIFMKQICSFDVDSSVYKECLQTT